MQELLNSTEEGKNLAYPVESAAASSVGSEGGSGRRNGCATVPLGTQPQFLAFAMPAGERQWKEECEAAPSFRPLGTAGEPRRIDAVPIEARSQLFLRLLLSLEMNGEREGEAEAAAARNRRRGGAARFSGRRKTREEEGEGEVDAGGRRRKERKKKKERKAGSSKF
ncbi:hypothetical protein JCGZ_12641 [Jatropha curcas]|uniref:Uncharacterized protein n=1 Tax=Jatropha curcas TaxID=180498 RepID=A0A067KQM2_JATCU|nr:hypothetical protein JCGZ_12641 [Jatropha curcas]